MLQAAVTLADQEGIEALTMRRLAQELGIEAMSIYHYVAGKDDILDGIIEMVFGGEIDIPSDRVDWKAAIRQIAISAHDVLNRHPWACSLMLSSAGVQASRLRYMESLLSTLRAAGFSAEMTDHGYHALDSHIMGFALWAVNIPDTEDLQAIGKTFLRHLPVDEYPYLAEHVEQHLAPSGDDVTEFEFGLDLILDGLERIRGRA